MTEAIILSCRRDFIIGLNCTNVIFNAFTPVGIGYASRSALSSETLLRVPFEIGLLRRGIHSWGVCREKIMPGKCGEIQISGVTPCRVNGNVRKDFAEISDYGLTYSDSGWKLLFPADGDNNSLPLITLGSEFVSNFTGYFKVERDESNGYRCVNGAEPDSAIAGRSDLGDLSSGAITPDASGVFWIYAAYDVSERKYSLLLTAPDGGTFGKHQIAHLDIFGNIVQDHISGYLHWSAFYAI